MSSNQIHGGRRSVGSGSRRSEKSLTVLTNKFMDMLRESPNGVMDLRDVKSQ